MCRDITKLKAQMREGLVYKIYCTAYNRETRLDTLQIGAQIDPKICFHGGNVHWLDGLYHDRGEAEATLAAIQGDSHV